MAICNPRLSYRPDIGKQRVHPGAPDNRAEEDEANMESVQRQKGLQEDPIQ